MLIDVAISEDRNVIKKADKMLKYENYKRNTAYVECKKQG